MAVGVKADINTKHNEKYIHGSAAPAFEFDSESIKEFIKSPVPSENIDLAPKLIHTPSRVQQRAPSVSLFAIVGFFAIAALMIFVMLAQVNYNEILRETARLSTHLDTLKEQQRVLSITFESVINMDEIERYAKDVLGMSKPEAEEITLMRTQPIDKIEIFEYDTTVDRWREIGEYLTFLFDEYIR